ncbi:aldehyde dehydrogenase [Amycolatopsis thermophila]|uniref:Acyl-CoA reductase-like NAD-dependent aldehyde dehydrogenase n=1 Tax=Amycolatopsis thermophila TaxID=206084 RepID=A0ABU0EYQ4_9PSEU|nr:aldehyde dehydrogenase [Amycolatopsis thermophila]MDQ0380449.1 acyl-CoA reductase-like NAD-dependent aldehyde dehydrogenase [Amycolatopsis thermophila]
MITYDKLLVGGEWTTPATTGVLRVRSPHDQSLVGVVPEASVADVDRAVTAAREAFDHGPWPRLAPAERQRVVARFTELHSARADELAALITSENGSPIWFTTWLQRSLRGYNDDFLETAAGFDWETELPGEDGHRTVVRRAPVGVVAAVIPWNAPHQSALVKMIPALLAGCPVILKPSPETAVDALRLAGILAEAGFPEGVVSVLPADRAVSEYLIAHPGVDKVAFTGSTTAGRRIAALAGERFKRVSLELGGKSASLVLPDADLTQLAEGLKGLALGNNGEACVAHTRILAPRSRYREVVDAIAGMMEGITVGDPADPATWIGPMVKEAQQQRVQSYIEAGLAEGARLVLGGPGAPDVPGLEKGFYVRPTLFADVANTMRIAREEIFGPVLAVIPFGTEDEAVAIANDSPYGLAGGVWTADPEHGLEVARRIRTGTFTVNGAPRDMRSPFGGFKASGFGREYGPAGLSAYTEYQSIGV